MAGRKYLTIDEFAEKSGKNNGSGKSTMMTADEFSKQNSNQASNTQQKQTVKPISFIDSLLNGKNDSLERIRQKRISNPVTDRAGFINDNYLARKFGLLSQNDPKQMNQMKLRNYIQSNQTSYDRAKKKEEEYQNKTEEERQADREDMRNTHDQKSRWDYVYSRGIPMVKNMDGEYLLADDSGWADNQEFWNKRPEDYNDDDNKRWNYDRILYDALHGQGAYDAWLDSLESDEEADEQDAYMESLWDAFERKELPEEYYKIQDELSEKEGALSGYYGSDKYQKKIDAAQKELDALDAADEYIRNAPEPVEGFVPDYKKNQPNYNTPGQMLFGGIAEMLNPSEKEEVDKVYDEMMKVPASENVWNKLFNQKSGFGEDTLTWEEYNSLQPAQFMNDEQRRAFEGYYTNGDRQSALEFYKVIEPGLTQLMMDAKDQYEQYLSSESSYAGVMIGKRIIDNPMAGILGMVGTIESLAGMEEAQDPNNALYWFTRQNANIQDARANEWGKKFKEWFGGSETAENIGRFLNGVAYSMADNLFAAAIGQGITTPFAGETSTKLAQGIVQFVMSSEATASEMYSRLESGMDPTEAAIRAMGTGVIEWVTEKASVEALLNPDVKDMLGDWKRLGSYLAKNTFAEGSEEVNSDLLGIVMDTVLSKVYGHESEFEEKLKEAEAEYGKDEALKHVLLDYAGDISLSALAGGIAGLGQSTGYAVAARTGKYMNTSSVGKTRLNSRGNYKGPLDVADSRSDKAVLYDNAFGMVQAGLKMDTDTESHKIAEDLEKDLQNGKKISNYKYGQLVLAVNEETDAKIAQIANDAMALRIQKSLEGEGVQRAREISGIVVKMLNGEELTDLEQETFDNSSAAQQQLMSYRFDLNNIIGMKQDIEAATKDVRSIQEDVLGVLGNAAKEVKSSFDSMFSGAKTATKADVLMAGGSKGTGTEVLADGKILDIKSVETQNVDGEKTVMLTLDNGEQVDAASVQAVNVNLSKLLQFVSVDGNKTGSDRFANVILNHVNNIRDMGAAMSDAFKVRLDTLLGRTGTKTNLSEEMVREIQDATLEDYNEAEEQRLSTQQTVNPGQGTATFDGVSFGSTQFADAIKGLAKNIRQEAYAVGEIAKAAGINVKMFFDPSNTKQQGWFDPQGGITINLAGENAGGTHHSAIATLAHEITHMLEAGSKQAYAALRSFVFDSLEKEGVNLRTRLQDIMYNYEKNDVDIDLNGAMAEMVAQGCDQILTDEDAIAHMKESDPTLFGNVKQAVKSFINRVWTAITGAKGSMSYESRNLQPYLKELSSLWQLAYDEVKNQYVDAEKMEKAAPAASVQMSMQQSNNRKQTIDIHDALKNPVKYNSYFTYNNLVKKSPIKAVQLNPIDTSKTREQILDTAMQNAEKYGRKDGTHVYVPVYDIGSEIRVGRRGLRHGLDQRIRENQPITENIGPVLQESVLINTAEGRVNGQTGNIKLLGAARNSNGKGITYAIFTVNSYTQELENIDYLYSIRSTGADVINNKKTAATGAKVAAKSLPLSVSYVNIADALNDVKNVFGDVLPKDVIKHFNMTRPSSKDGHLLQHSVQDLSEDELNRLKTEADNLYESWKSAKGKYDQLINGDEMKAFNERIKTANTTEEQMTLINEMQEWQERNNIKALQDEIYDTDKKQKAAQKAYDEYRDQMDLAEEQRKIKESGMTEADWRRKQAINLYGYTGDFREAGYLLPNGRMLNFCGSKGQHYGMRGNDHRDIGQLYANKQGTEAMNAFMADGNIRVMAETPGVDIVVEPTTAQYTAIRNMAYRFAQEEYFSVDFSDERGNNIGSLEYEGNINPSRIVNDIRTYFRTGEVPQRSITSQFHYSVQDDTDYMNAVNSGDMETAQKMVDKAAKEAGYTIRAYHGSNKAFTQFKGGNRGEMWFGDRAETAYKRDYTYDTYLRMNNPYEVTYFIGADSKFDPTQVTEESRINGHDGGIVHFKLDPEYVNNALPILSKFAMTLPATDSFGDNFTFMPHGKDRENLVRPGEKMVDFMKRGAKETLYDWYVVSNPTQIKSAEPVTYDGNGNVIPLSERFNMKNPDIRYSMTDDGEIRNDDGETIAQLIDGQMAVKYSYQTWTPEEQTRVLEDLKKSGFSRKEIINWMADVNSIAAIIASNRDRWDFDPTEGQFYLKDNAEYIKTLDASTLCAKRILYQGTFNEIQNQLPNTPLMPSDLIDLLNIMKAHEDVVPCSICYVESRRKNLGKFTAKWLANYKGEYKPKIAELTTTDGLERLKNTHRQAYDDYVAAMNRTGTSNPKVVQMRTAYDGDINKLTENDIRKIVALGGLRVQSFSDFETIHLLDMMQAVMDMASRKLTSQAYTKVPNFAWVFGNTGIKINLSLIGAGTGLDANGNLVFDDVEGMPHEEAFKIRNAYSKNVGTILVGINDDHIIAAMGDKRIDFIIPFHKNGWSKEEFSRIGTLRNYNDYTYFQNERVILGPRKVTVNKKTEDSMKKWLRGQSKWMTGYTVTKTEKGYRIDAHGYGSISFKNEKDAADAKFKENNSDERATARSNFNPVGEGGYWNWNLTGPQNAEAYLRKCKKDGRLPKFWQYLQDNGDGSFSLPTGNDKRSKAIREGYWKTLIDFKMYDNEGNAARQMPVQPNFNMVEARRVMEEYEAPEGGNNALPKDMDVANEFVRKYKEKHPGRKVYSVQDESDAEIQHWMDTVKPEMLNTEAERMVHENFTNLKTRIELRKMAEDELTPKIRDIEKIPEEQRTAKQKKQLREYKIRLANARSTKQQAQEQMARLFGNKQFARVMREQNRTYNQYMAGKTQEELRTTVEAMQQAVDAITKRIEQNQKDIAEIEKTGTVQQLKKILGTTSVEQMAGELKKKYHSTWTKSELRNFIDPILIKMGNGEDFTQDVQDLAGILIESNEELIAMDEELRSLRGETIVLNEGQLRELRGQNKTLKEIRSELAGTGIKVVSGGANADGTLVENLDNFLTEYPFLQGEISENDKDALDSFMTWVKGRKEKGIQTIDYAGELADAMAVVMQKVTQAAHGIYMPTETKAQKQVLDLIEYVKSLNAKTEAAEKAMREIAVQMGEMTKANQQAIGMANMMQQNVGEALKYYDKMAKLAMDTAKAQKQSAIIEQLKSKQAQKIAKNNEEWRNLIERDRQARNVAELNTRKRNIINTDIKRMYHLLRDQSATKNMPEYMQALARAVIDDFVNNDLVGNKVLRADPEQLAEAKRLLLAWTKQNGPATYGEIMDQLEDAEEAVGQALMLDRDAIIQALQDWNSEIKGKNKLDIMKQRGEILNRMQQAVSEIYGAIQAERMVQAGKRRVETVNQAYKVMVETKGKRYREWTGKAGGVITTLRKAIISGNMTPEYFFRTIGNAGLTDLWENYHEAENRNGIELAKAQNRLAEIAAQHGFKTWDMNQKLRVDIGGNMVDMTLGQLMSLWATWKRENTLGPQMSEHLTKGGFYAEQDLKEGFLGRTETQRKAHRVDEADMQRVEAMLTDEQKAFVDDIVSYMSNEMSQLGNEASMKAYGIKLYKEDYYFPFQMWDGVKTRKSNDSGAGANVERAFHPSFSKTRIHGANNALVIGDFMQTAADHIAGMINYATMGLANDSMQKVLNEKMVDADPGENMTEGTQRNIRAILEEAYGREAMQYLAELQKQLNGGAVKIEKTMYDKAISLFRKNAVAGSLSVAAQQPLSYIRAATMINSKYLASALTKEYWKGSYKELLKHSGVAVIKEMGRFDMNAGQSAREYLTPDQKQTKWQAAWNQITDKATILPEKMDAWTWTRMWVAVKAEQHALHPEMDMKSDEFLDMCGERFNDIMRRTQVYDSVLVRSQNMRSQNPWIKSITSFMAEPTVTLNVLADAVRSAKNGEKGGKMLLIKAGATFLLSAAMQAAVKALFSTGRTPDDKKTWEENYEYRLFSNLIQEVDPLQLVPGFSDLITLLKDGELNDDAMGAVGKIMTAGRGMVDVVLGNGKKGLYRDLEDSAAQITQLFTNLPAKNIMRDLRAMYNWFIDPPYAKRPTDSAVIANQSADAFWNADNLIGWINKELGEAGYQAGNKAYYQRIYEAKKAGDNAKAQSMIDYLIKGKGVKESSITTGVNSAAKNDKGASAADTAQFLIREGSTTADDYIRDGLKKGTITEADAKKLLKQADPKATDDDIWWTIDRIKFQNETGATKVSGNYYRLKDAINKNSSQDIKAAVKDLKAHGYDDKKIKSWIGNKSTGFKTAYLNAKGNEKVKIKNALIMAYKAVGVSESEANQIINKWK